MSKKRGGAGHMTHRLNPLVYIQEKRFGETLAIVGTWKGCAWSRKITSNKYRGCEYVIMLVDISPYTIYNVNHINFI